MKNQPVKQHLIAKVYLKKFKIDDTSHVYCIDLRKNKDPGIKKTGVGSEIFTIEDFYTDLRLEEPYTIENFFSEKLERNWPTIFKELDEKQPLSKKTKMLLINWIYASNFKNRLTRLNYERILNFSYETISAYKKNEIDTKSLHEYTASKAKDMQLDSFVDFSLAKERHNLFEGTLANKQWKILEAPLGYFYLTNDKPVFSPNMHPLHRKHFPFHVNPELNSQSQIYFVLSPKYCLEISPYLMGTPLDINLWNTNPEYEIASEVGVWLVNNGIIHTADRFIISNNYDLLEQLVRVEKK